MSAGATGRRQLAPFAALSASYFAHIGFFNPYLPLWLKELGFGLFAISVLTSVQAATRLFAPYGWGWLSDHTGERVKLLRYGATTALLVSLGLWFELSPLWLGAVLLVMFTHTSSMMPMSEAAMAHLVSQGGAFDARRYGRVRLWGSLGFLVTVFAAGAWFEHAGMGHFPAWTTLTLAAVTVSVWFLPDLKEAIPAHEAKVPVLPVLRQRAVQWFFAAAFFHVLSHIGIYVFFSLYLDSLGYSKTMIGLLWAVSVIVEIGWFFTQSRWLHQLSLAALAGAVLGGHGAAHGHHGQQRQRAGGAAAGAGAARLHLCHAPHGVHRAAVAPLSGATARARAGALHRHRLRLSGRARRPGRRDFELKIRPCQRVLVVELLPV